MIRDIGGADHIVRFSIAGIRAVGDRRRWREVDRWAAITPPGDPADR